MLEFLRHRFGTKEPEQTSLQAVDPFSIKFFLEDISYKYNKNVPSRVLNTINGWMTEGEVKNITDWLMMGTNFIENPVNFELVGNRIGLGTMLTAIVDQAMPYVHGDKVWIESLNNLKKICGVGIIKNAVVELKLGCIEPGRQSRFPQTLAIEDFKFR